MHGRDVPVAQSGDGGREVAVLHAEQPADLPGRGDRTVEHPERGIEPQRRVAVQIDAVRCAGGGFFGMYIGSNGPRYQDTVVSPCRVMWSRAV